MGVWRTSVTVAAPRDEVFALFADRENYRDLVGPIGGRLVTPGTTTRQGEGAVHKIGVGRVGMAEQIVALDPGRSFTYRAVSRMPVRHWIGIVDFHDVAGGTRVDYALDVDSALPLPGPVMRAVVKGLAGGLARGAGKRLRAS